MFKTCLAIGTSKAVTRLVSTLKLGAGTSLPGKLARKIEPGVLSSLGGQIQKEIIAVSGTNGKTTTCGLLAQFLRQAQQRVVHNQLGANMVPGITAALLNQSSLNGKLIADYGVLEVDEASLKGVAKELIIDRVLVTNLFRDQLDRYGELDTTARLIKEGIETSSIRSDTPSRPRHLILNADDPLVAGIPLLKTAASQTRTLPHGKTHYYGVRQVSYPFASAETSGPKASEEVKFNQESAACPLCSGELHYDYPIYGHLGHYHCKACDYKRPEPSVEAENVIIRPDGSTVFLKVGHKRLSIELNLPGLFNVYNFLAAVAVLADLDIPLAVLQPALDEYQSVFGRAEKTVLHGKNALVMLIKNPVGASEVIKLVAGDPKGRLWIALNDNYADGRDVSWIWDAQFELIAAAGHNKPITVSGGRANDMAIRLKYAGIASERITVIPDLNRSILEAAQQTEANETLYLMPTYTALLDLRPLLAASSSRA
ncbi:MAG: MurT ligase domain-containing protein [Vampirovibrionales bacterium]|nr:MurT ligase domain-containing protein [Vampirovibrionales bacterium]